MITERDLQEAIAECQGQRNPNANTCIKLAAYYIIRNEMFGIEEPPTEMPVYSRAEPPADFETQIDYDSGSEFSRMINNIPARDVWPIMDELMDTLQVINPRLYSGVMQRLDEV